jgi:hypothetical protein
MSAAKESLAFMSSPDRGIGNPALAIDHVLAKVENPDCSVTETWWWCFHIEERNINGEVYFWKHSNLNMMSGGVWIFEGIKKHHLLCEHFNFQNFIPAPVVSENTLYSSQLDLRIRIVEPLKRHEVLYRHEATGTMLRLCAEAMGPPVLRSNNAHFEQVQKMTGELRLAGESLTIDCMSFRDRSWGEPRPEPQVVHPPTAWSVGVSADASRSFCFSACDDPERTPLVAHYGISKADALKIGWISENGVLRKIVAASKCTTRGADGLQAESFDVALTDESGRSYELKGRVTASVMWSPWPNMAATFGQHVVWSLDGHRMTGETQEVFWADCIKKMLGPASLSAGRL